MRRIRLIYIHQYPHWTDFQWNEDKIAPLLTSVRHKQGWLLGRMESMGFNLRAEATLQTLTLDVLKSSEIEGELLKSDQVRSSVARRLGMNIGGLVPSDKNVDGVVKMMMDATQHREHTLSQQRLFEWHNDLFPSGKNTHYEMVLGGWRNNLKDDPMQVVSGALGKEKIHFQAPDAELLPDEMDAFIKWFNAENQIDPVIKAAIAHLWFITVHPFDDGNGRMARAIADMQLARSDGSSQRFYSMSAQIRKERNAYYNILELTQKGTPDITAWIEWFLECLDRAVTSTEDTLSLVMKKSRFWEQHSGLLLNGRQRLMLNKILDGFDGKLTSSKWAKIAKCSSDTAVRDINDLLAKKILMRENAGGRSTSYNLIS